MKILETISDVRTAVGWAKGEGLRTGFVPTMGDLHAGHMALVAAAKAQTDFVIVSVFVNPTQFGPGEDYERYPRNLARDSQICEGAGVDVLFAPSVSQMYPDRNLAWVNVKELSEPLCGKSRPGHFRGVCTVCAKLFNIVQPDIAFFGRKDAQQAIIIERMVRDLNMPLSIVVCPTVREPDGLAMSSRNRYLNPQERKDAAAIYRALQGCATLLREGVRDAAILGASIRSNIEKTPSAQIEYVGIMDAVNLRPVGRIEGKALIAVAVRIGSTRLIDNLTFDPVNNEISL
jgi:pantoate--beta-alanine ligase